MASDVFLAPLLAGLRDLVAWFKAERVRGVIIGGVANSLLGRPRATQDVDALILLDEMQWQDFVASGVSFGFEPRIPDPLPFAREARMLLLRHRPSGIEVDLSLGMLPFEKEVVERATTKTIHRISVPLPRAEDLIIMKAVAHRPRDLADIEGILAAHPRLNRKRVRQWVRQFAEALEAPEIHTALEAILTPRHFKKKRKP